MPVDDLPKSTSLGDMTIKELYNKAEDRFIDSLARPSEPPWGAGPMRVKHIPLVVTLVAMVILICLVTPFLLAIPILGPLLSLAMILNFIVGGITMYRRRKDWLVGARHARASTDGEERTSKQDGS